LNKADFQAAADVLHGWRDEVLSGKAPMFYPIGEGELSRIEIGPGLVTLLGGAPGAGKTAFTMQAVVDALRLTPTLRAVVCNIEMPPAVLLDRQLARLSGVDLTTIRYRRLTEEHAERIDAGLNTLDELAERLAFVRPPFDLANVAAVADEFDAGLIVLDYIQRIQPPGDHGDKRGSVDATMSHLRAFADAGVAVIVLSAVGRTKDRSGRSSYSGDGLNLASFRESSELEFGADDAFILTPGDEAEGEVILRHLKSRNGACRDLRLAFDKPLQRFTPYGDGESTATAKREPRGKLRAAIADLWGLTAAADHDTGDEWGRIQ
jgi:replicative DNA helicase